MARKESAAARDVACAGIWRDNGRKSAGGESRQEAGREKRREAQGATAWRNDMMGGAKRAPKTPVPQNAESDLALLLLFLLLLLLFDISPAQVTAPVSIIGWNGTILCTQISFLIASHNDKTGNRRHDSC